MMETNELIQNILALGAGKAALIPADQIVLAASFRDACAQNSCGAYGKYWVCPPACGEIEALMTRVRSFDQAILYESVGHFEDSFDIDGMIAARRAHSALSRRIEEELRGLLPPERLHLSVGGCDLCKACTYPDDLPCRFPDKQVFSMSAFGLFVSQVCKDNGMEYNHGKDTMTYSSCFLLE